MAPPRGCGVARCARYRRPTAATRRCPTPQLPLLGRDLLQRQRGHPLRQLLTETLPTCVQGASILIVALGEPEEASPTELLRVVEGSGDVVHADVASRAGQGIPAARTHDRAQEAAAALPV